MKSKFCIYLTFLSSCVFTSCKSQAQKHIGRHTDIYLAGVIRKYYSKQKKDTLSTAVYWKNGIIVQLSDSLTDAWVNGIAVHNKDVYVVGYIKHKADNSHEINFAAYWKNGVLTQLGEGAINGVAFNGNDVYMVGVAKGKEIYWKNNHPKVLGDGQLNSIYVDADNVYIAGNKIHYLSKGDGVEREWASVANCWKNDKEIIVGRDGTEANYIFVQNGNVRVAGSNLSKPAYWEDNRDYTLEISKKVIKGITSGIIIDTQARTMICGAIYLGYYNWKAVYWVNNKIMFLPHKGSTSLCHAIASFGSDIYIAGEDRDKPVYWKNGQLASFSTDNGRASALAIVNH